MLICTINPYILTPDSPRLITCQVSFKNATHFNYLKELYQLYSGVNVVHLCKLTFGFFFFLLFIHGCSVKQNLCLQTYYIDIYTVVHLWYSFISHCYVFIFCATFPKFILKLSLPLEIKCVTFEDHSLFSMVPAEVDGLSFVQ